MSVSHFCTLFDTFETTYHVIKIYLIWCTTIGSQFAGDEYKFTHGYQRCFPETHFRGDNLKTPSNWRVLICVYTQITSYHK